MKLKNNFLMALIAIFCLTATPSIAFQELPTNPAIKIGKLANGLTYYIQENKFPANRVQFRLAINAGSIQEDDDQQGLAHFTEHMLFNGTKNFEKNELISFLQKMGLEFGGDLNAYTSFDETVYFLPIPTEDPDNVDKALLVLSDWAHNATFEDEEIDKERGVVMEEWRLRLGANERMRAMTWPIYLNGSKYADRLPIGKPEILENFEYDAAKRYYRDWYRPDLMAVIAIGDFDAAEMEAKIKEYFDPIPAVENPRERETFGLNDFEGTRVAVATDEEATSNTITVNYITPGSDEEKSDTERFKTSVLNGLFGNMIGQRLSELTQKSDPPFIFAYSGYGRSFVRNKSEYTIYAAIKEGQFERGLNAALIENERVRRFGFTTGELERTKALYKNSYERSALEAAKQQSGRLVGAPLNHFLSGSLLMSASQRLDALNAILSDIQLEEVNALIKDWMRDENRVIIVNAKESDKDKIPTEAKLKSLLDDVVSDTSIEPYKEEAIAAALMTSFPTKGTVTSSEKNELTGITKMELSNGAKVYLKPTDFKNDEVRMTAYSWGGTSLYGDDEAIDADYASLAGSVGGLGEFSAIDLGKFMTGKTANVNASIGDYEEGLSGFSSKKDLESFFQLLHLRFTSPRKDEEVFKSYISRLGDQIKNYLSGPDGQYQVELNKILYGDHPRAGGVPSLEDLEKIDMDRAFDIYKERFADAGDFTFVFVGNISEEELRPMLEKYVASLSATNSNENFNDLGIELAKGVVNEELYFGVDEKSSTRVIISGDYEVNLEENGYMNAAASILTNKMIEKLREEMGGVYGVGANWGAIERPKGTFRFQISFPSSPDNADELAEAAMAELEKVKAGDFTDEDLQKVISARIQNFDEGKKTNGFWQGSIPSYLKSGYDLELILKNAERANGITREKIIATMNKYLTNENIIKVVKLPAGYKKKSLNQEIKNKE
jgi:zinc protease